MSKHRKTVDVAYLITECNKLLRLNTVSAEFRKGVSAVLEGVLHHTDNYEGFNYVFWCEEGGFLRWRADSAALKAIEGESAQIETTAYLGDETRRFYYTNRNLPSCGREAALVSSTFSLPTPEANDLLYPLTASSTWWCDPKRKL